MVADVDLASAIDDPARRRSALSAVTAGRLELGAGEHLDPDLVATHATVGVVVLSGFVVRELTTGPGRVSADLFGPEDVVQPDRTVPEVAMLEHTDSWTAITDARLALLDRAFFERAGRWPEIVTGLIERAGRVEHRAALRGAIATLQSVDARLLASLWTWASQWATVAGQGVVLRVPLSHERLARLVNARRPTVTTAIGRLRSSGLIAQRRDGAWLLTSPSADDNGLAKAEGVGMPALREIVTAPRPHGPRIAAADARVVAARELRARLGEQREALRVAVDRHNEMLERLRKESGLMRAAARR